MENKKGSSVPIDPEKMKAFCAAHGGQTAVSESIGRGGSYIKNCIARGWIDRPALLFLCKVYGVKEYTFTPDASNQTLADSAAALRSAIDELLDAAGADRVVKAANCILDALNAYLARLYSRGGSQ